MAKTIDLSVITGAEKAARYPSEHVAPAATPLQKTLPGRVLTGKRIRVDADKTILFSGNPRNFSSNKDISDLKPLIVRTGGNSAAVDARMVHGKIEVIAGSRRRECCIETGLKLACDLWDDVSDEEAVLIAEIENSGRKDIDFMGYCTYLAARFDDLKKSTPSLTVDRFGEYYSLTRQYMTEKIQIGRLPDWLKDSAKPGAAWSHRQGQKLSTLHGELTSMGVDVQNEMKAAGIPLSTPSMALSVMTGLREKYNPTTKTMPRAREIHIGDGVVTIEESSRGQVKIQTKQISADAKAAILDFLSSLETK